MLIYSLFVILVIVILVIVLFHISTRYSRAGRLVDTLPGYKPVPIFGNLIRLHTSDSHEFWKLIREFSNKFYPITRVWFFRSAVISIRHPDDAEILLTSQKAIDKGYAYDYLQPWLKTGLLTSTGSKWKQRRKILTPAFHFNVLKKYLEITNDHGEKCILNLKKEGKETVKNLVKFSSNFTLNVMCESAMGVVLEKNENVNIDVYKKATLDFGSVVVHRIPRPYIFNWMMKLPWKFGNLQSSALDVLHKFTEQVVTERRNYHNSNGDKYLMQLNDLEDDDIGCKRRLAMLDLLLAAEKNDLIDDDGIKEEVDTFTFEGHDTTATGMTFALLLLAENEEAQERARNEVKTVLDKSGGKLSMTELQELHYLDRCVKESLRLFPPVSTVFRFTKDDLQLKNGLVPGGSHIVFHIYDLHRDSNFWKDPEKFDPDRFLPEHCLRRHPFAYLPFSAGPRNCIGQKFAMMELKAALAYILNNFYLEPIDRSSDVELIADIVIRPRNPVSMKFVQIDRADGKEETGSLHYA